MVGLDDEVVADALPLAATRHALEEQDTSELRVEARRYAEARMRHVRDIGQPVPRNYATELVDDAIADTRVGIARWDPARCSLLVHIRGVILDRTAKEVRRGRRFPHVSIHVAADDSSDAGVEHLPDREILSVAFVGLIFCVASELKMMAPGDVNAQTVLGCWHVGIVERDTVMARTGLTLAAYKATRKRLFALSKKLSPKLGESARELFRSIS